MSSPTGSVEVARRKHLTMDRHACVPAHLLQHPYRPFAAFQRRTLCPLRLLFSPPCRFAGTILLSSPPTAVAVSVVVAAAAPHLPRRALHPVHCTARATAHLAVPSPSPIPALDPNPAPAPARAPVPTQAPVPALAPRVNYSSAGGTLKKEDKKMFA